MHILLFRKGLLHISVRSGWFILLFKFFYVLADILTVLLLNVGILSFKLLPLNYLFCSSIFHVCFMYFQSLLSGAYIFIIIITSWSIDPYHYKWFYFAVGTNFVSKFILFAIVIAAPALCFLFAWHIFYYPFTINIFMSLFSSDFIEKHLTYIDL